ncbi:MAG: hypothetical protein JOZ03_14545 [Gammaproteobacteria bacterium]|nr:hypothetical protein [Gammaproteobacteria bacterium]
MKKQLTWLLAAMLAVLIAGCANQKAPAEQALAAAESALAQVRDSAQKYVPDQLAAVDTQLQGLKDAYAKGDYKAVLTGAPTLTNAINTLKDAAAAKQQESEAANAKAKDAWNAASADLPKMVDAISSRVAMLSKSRHLPKGVTKDAVDKARSAVEDLRSRWTEANSAAGSGDYVTAMSHADAIRTQANEIMQSLKMSSG